MLYKLDSIRKIHGNTVILDIDSLEIVEGKAYSLTGPNGAGKSTLLNLLAFLDIPSQGELVFQEEVVQYHQGKLQELRRKVVLVDQYPILFTGSVRKNVEFGLHVRGVSQKQKDRVVEEVLEMVGMQNFIGADAQTLSGGETKRVALARALAVSPDVLLCDEPTANVDVENQEIIVDILKKCSSEKGTSLVFATHSFSEARHLASHSIELRNGRLAPGGKSNVFTVQPLQKNGDVTILLIGDKLKYHLRGEESIPGGHQRVFFDPESISCRTLQEASEKKQENSFWQGRVKKAELRGEDVWLVVDCGLDIEVIMSSTSYTERALLVNDPVAVDIPWQQMRFLKE